VAALYWKTSPRAAEPGNCPEYQSERKERCAYPDRPTAAASRSSMAQPMSSWQRTYVIQAVVVGAAGRARNAWAASCASPAANMDHTCTIRVLWYARSLTFPW
jgi:hypothetical protein